MARRFAVVFFYKRLLNAGGAERVFIEECRYFESRGAQVHILSYEASPQALFGYPLSSVEIIRGKSPIGRLYQLRRQLQQISPCAAITAYGHYEVYLATRLTSIPYIFCHHSPVLLYWNRFREIPYSFLHRKAFPHVREANYGNRHLVPSRWPYGPFSRIVMEFKAVLDFLAVRAARLVVTLSHQTCRELRLMYGVDAVPWRGCLDADVFSYYSKKDSKSSLGLVGRRIILNVNRLTVEKRVDVLIQSFALISHQYPDAVLLIGGIGPERLKLECLASSLAIDDKVLFLGFVPETDLWDYYAGCDVFATPAWADFNIAPYEALALGAKVVWSSEMEPWEGELESGRIFPAEPDPASFADALDRALTAPSGRMPQLDKYLWENRFSKTYDLCSGLALESRGKLRIERVER